MRDRDQKIKTVWVERDIQVQNLVRLQNHLIKKTIDKYPLYIYRCKTSTEY